MSATSLGFVLPAALLAWSWDDVGDQDRYLIALGGLPLLLVMVGIIGVLFAVFRRPHAR